MMDLVCLCLLLMSVTLLVATRLFRRGRMSEVDYHSTIVLIVIYTYEPHFGVQREFLLVVEPPCNYGRVTKLRRRICQSSRLCRFIPVHVLVVVDGSVQLYLSSCSPSVPMLEACLEFSLCYYDTLGYSGRSTSSRSLSRLVATADKVGHRQVAFEYQSPPASLCS